MKTLHITKTVSADGTIVLEGLPFVAGDEVEIVIQSREPDITGGAKNPLSGTVTDFINPCEPVADDDWEANQ
jgi:hypothetical protein